MNQLSYSHVFEESLYCSFHSLFVSHSKIKNKIFREKKECFLDGKSEIQMKDRYRDKKEMKCGEMCLYTKGSNTKKARTHKVYKML